MRTLDKPVLAVVLPLPLLAAALSLAGCMMQPPARVQSSLAPSPDLAAVNPADIAVLPIEDASPGRNARDLLPAIHRAVSEALVERQYSPLDAHYVQQRLQEQGTGVANASLINVPVLGQLAGKFGEDALLAIRLTRWDTSSLMSTAVVRFGADVTMLDKEKRVLWSGDLQGEVKAGGEGPAPLDREQRLLDTARRFARELILRLPRRRV